MTVGCGFDCGFYGEYPARPVVDYVLLIQIDRQALCDEARAEVAATAGFGGQYSYRSGGEILPDCMT